MTDVPEMKLALTFLQLSKGVYKQRNKGFLCYCACDKPPQGAHMSHPLGVRVRPLAF